MLERTLSKLAETILSLDEASLNSLWNKYREKMEVFQSTKEWERSVIIFFIINSVRVKNHIFNERIKLRDKKNMGLPPNPPQKPAPYLRRVK